MLRYILTPKDKSTNIQMRFWLTTTKSDRLLDNAKKIFKKYTWSQTADKAYKAFKSL